ncbi:MAG: hypothetical protein M1822_009701 [Bathelium mastoideum]|nr:MAG: hypothetical protein M1822_009701 [Bathelium mastoideum]
MNKLQLERYTADGKQLAHTTARQQLEQAERLNPEDKWAVHQTTLNYALTFREEVNEIVDEIYAYVLQSNSWRVAFSSTDEFQEAFIEAQQNHEQITVRDANLQAVRRRIQERWGSVVITSNSFAHLMGSVSAGNQFRSFLIKHGSDKTRAIECLNIARLKRLAAPGRGKSTNRRFQPTDLHEAARIIREHGEKSPKSLPDADQLNEGYQDFEMGRDMTTWIFEEGRPRQITAPHARLPSGAASPLAPGSPTFAPGSPMIISPAASPRISGIWETVQRRSESPVRTPRRMTRSMTGALSRAISSQLILDPARSRAVSIVMGDAESPQSPLTEIYRQREVSLEEDDEFVEAEAKPHGCDCSRRVATTLKAELRQEPKLQRDQIRLLVRFIRVIESRGRDENKAAVFCNKHLRAMGGILGLKTKRLTNPDLVSRLEFVYKNRDRIGDIKTGRETFTWWRLTARPYIQSDQLGIFKYEPGRPIRSMRGEITHEHAKTILQKLHMSRAQWDNWMEDGSVNLDCFRWLWDAPPKDAEPGSRRLIDMIREEYDMYLHHQRELNGEPNYGWLRSMWHGIGQQIIRQDPLYYLYYVLLRPDHNTWLISYPYYAKYTKAGDHTEFRHIDHNVPKLLEGRGISEIQGSASLDDETPDGCTLILPGIHRCLRQWWERMHDRGLTQGGYVTGMPGGLSRWYSEQDAKEINKGKMEKAVPCKAGQVRITDGRLPHGSTASPRVRRTVLPWYCGIQNDHESLAITEAGTWSQLSAAHIALKPGPSTPSGKPNAYGTIPYAFPAATCLTGLGPISDALVGRRRWTDVMVDHDVRALMQDPWAYITRWRQRNWHTIYQAFTAQRRSERVIFGPKSYYAAMHGGDILEEDDDALDEEDMADILSAENLEKPKEWDEPAGATYSFGSPSQPQKGKGKGRAT